MSNQNDPVMTLLKLLAEAPEDQLAPSVLDTFQKMYGRNKRPTVEELNDIRTYLSNNALSSDFVVSTLDALISLVMITPHERI